MLLENVANALTDEITTKKSCKTVPHELLKLLDIQKKIMALPVEDSNA